MWPLHCLLLVELVKEVRNTKAIGFGELEYPLGYLEARTGYFVGKGIDTTGLPTQKERTKKQWQKKLFSLSCHLNFEVNFILPFRVWELISLRVSFLLLFLVLSRFIAQWPNKVIYFFPFFFLFFFSFYQAKSLCGMDHSVLLITKFHFDVIGIQYPNAFRS